MDVFNWTPLFETGIARVDDQHRRLVAIVNRLGDLLISGQVDPARIDEEYQALARYAQQHFADEEGLMAEAALDPRYIEHHRQQHREFVAQLGALWLRRSATTDSADALHGFLSSWLTFHILDEDQGMARQIDRRRAGRDAAQSALPPESTDANGNAVLLASMRKLHRALADTNVHLEEQVRARTRDLLQAEKMAAIGQLAAGIAHEINNPISFVTSNLGALGSYASRLLDVIDDCAELAATREANAERIQAICASADLAFLRTDLAALLAESREGLQRVTTIVGTLQHFARGASDARVDADLLAGLERMLGVTAALMKDRVTLVRQLTPLPLVCCVPHQIDLVFMNLLVNATQALTGPGEIVLRSGFDDDGVWVEISDSGSGIAAEHLPRLFEPFFTTRPVGSGIGLGLTTAWDIVVDKHGGRIDVRSSPGAGASFTVSLPRAHRETPSTRTIVRPDRLQATDQADALIAERDVAP
jgi:hemerythrin-like metal-binding protein